MTQQNYRHKTEREQLITERDALKQDLKTDSSLTAPERFVVADRIDKLNEKIETTK